MREKISDDLRWAVLKRDGYRCRYCGSSDGPFHLDHVYPVSKGGETTIDNLVTSCPRCNLKKHDKVGVWPWPEDLTTLRPKLNWHFRFSIWFFMQTFAIILGVLLTKRQDYQEFLWPAILSFMFFAISVVMGIRRMMK